MFCLRSFCCFNKRRRFVSEFSSKLYEIAQSDIFRADELNDRDICLSEAFILLWQDWFTGEVDGLWTNSCLLAATYSCLLLELIALGKITLTKKQVAAELGIYIQVVDQELTNSFLDEATFSQIVRSSLDNEDSEIFLVRTVSRAVKCRLCSRTNCATETLESLKEKKVLKQTDECFGLRRLYRTIDLEPRGQLEREIRMIALKSKTPDCYMRILLTFARMADAYASKSDKLLRRCFTKNEYTEAMERIDNLTVEWSSES